METPLAIDKARIEIHLVVFQAMVSIAEKLPEAFRPN
jgi:hypothetical protein